MLARISSRQLAEWQAFWQLEPFGDEWRQAGTVAAAAASPWLKQGARVTPEHYLPVQPPEEEAEPKSGAEILAIFQGLAAQKGVRS